jgi:hypothetical protein
MRKRDSGSEEHLPFASASRSSAPLTPIKRHKNFNCSKNHDHADRLSKEQGRHAVKRNRVGTDTSSAHPAHMALVLSLSGWPLLEAWLVWTHASVRDLALPSPTDLKNIVIATIKISSLTMRVFVIPQIF